MEKTAQKPLDISTMTTEEIDQELEKGMKDIAEGRTRPAREFFKDFRKEYGI